MPPVTTSNLFQTVWRALAISALLWFGGMNGQDAMAQPAPGAVVGRVVDAFIGIPLRDASVAIYKRDAVFPTRETVTRADGRYLLPLLQPGRYVVRVLHAGYLGQEKELYVTPGDPQTLHLYLDQSSLDQHTGIQLVDGRIVHGRQVAAAVSVTNGREMLAQAAPLSQSSLPMQAGLHQPFLGLGQRDFGLRGFNLGAAGEPMLLVDEHRPYIAGFGMPAQSMLPLSILDVDRIETMRGPHAARFGWGGSRGAVHVATRDAFDFPGTSLAFGAGEQGVMQAEFRHAGRINDRFGYKLTGITLLGDNWGLQSGDSTDQSILQVEGFRDAAVRQIGGQAQVVYQQPEGLRIELLGGTGFRDGWMLTPLGVLQADGLSNSFGRLRVEGSALDAYFGVSKNAAGKSQFYGGHLFGDDPLPWRDESRSLDAGLAYDVLIRTGRQRVQVGGSFQSLLPQTQGLLHGVNENHDAIRRGNVFTQSMTRIGTGLEIWAMLRAEMASIDPNLAFAPRAGLVWQAKPQQRVWLSAGRAYADPRLYARFADVSASYHATPGSYSLAYRVMGAQRGFTFNQFRDDQQVAFLWPGASASIGEMMPLSSLPLRSIYGHFAEEAQNWTGMDATVPAMLNGFSGAQLDQLVQLIDQIAPLVNGVTAGELGLPGHDGAPYAPIEAPLDVAPLRQTISNTLELGYRGSWYDDRLMVTAEAFIERKEHALGTLSHATPLVYLPELDADLETVIAPLIADLLRADPTRTSFAVDMGYDANALAEMVAQLAATGILDGAGFSQTPIAAVQPDQMLPTAGSVEVVNSLVTFRNAGPFSYWGADFSIEWAPSHAWQLGSTFSWVSGNIFETTDTAGLPSTVLLNAPKFSATGVIRWQSPSGLSVFTSGRHVDGFPVQLAGFSGSIPSYSTLDAGIGFDAGRYFAGLRLDVAAQNLLTFSEGRRVTQHREFAGVPKTGRLLLARVIYTF